VIVAKMRSEKNLSKLLWLDFDFNWTLCGAARNLVPRLLMNSVRELLDKYSHLLETLWVSPGSITQGYEHVVDAVRNGESERARTLMRSIWEGRHARFVAAARRDSRPPRSESC
jgi:DNA-binding FadR family transcriptional regulator